MLHWQQELPLKQKLRCVLRLVVFIGLSASLTSCSWVRTDPIEKFQANTIPLRIGVVLEDNRAAEAEGKSASDYLGPDIVGYLQAWRVFDEILFPYQGSEDVDAVVYLSAQGEIDIHDVTNAAKSFLNGLTMGLFLSIVGKTADFEHQADIRIVSQGQLISSYSAEVETDLRASLARKQWEDQIGRDALDEAKRAHASRLAKALAVQIQADRSSILQATGTR